MGPLPTLGAQGSRPLLACISLFSHSGWAVVGASGARPVTFFSDFPGHGITGSKGMDSSLFMIGCSRHWNALPSTVNCSLASDSANPKYVEKFSPSSLVSVTTSAHARRKFVCLFFTLLSPCSHHNEGTSSNETKRKYSNILYTHTHIHAQSLQSCLTVWDPIVYSLPGSSVHGVLQTRILEWVVTPSSRGSSRPRDSTHVSCLLYWQGSFLPLEPPGRSI